MSTVRTMKKWIEFNETSDEVKAYAKKYCAFNVNMATRQLIKLGLAAHTEKQGE
jgi:hypothetical protein